MKNPGFVCAAGYDICDLKQTQTIEKNYHQMSELMGKLRKQHNFSFVFISNPNHMLTFVLTKNSVYICNRVIGVS